jgi:DNA repair ATPase RecN
MSLSPQETGDSNLDLVLVGLGKLRAEGKRLPMRGNRPNIDELVKLFGLTSRQPFYRNKTIQAALLGFIREQQGQQVSVDAEQSQRELQDVRSKLMKTEQRSAVLAAENDALKARNKELEDAMQRMKTEEEILLSGRRVIL